MRLYGYSGSANAYKVELALAQLHVAYERVEVAIFSGESRTPEFLSKNPAGRVPVLELDRGTYIVESNAILWHVARGTPLLPRDPLEETRVLSWLCFEQNEVEPIIGSARFWILTGRDRTRREELARKIERAAWSLGVLDRALADRRFLAGGAYTIADVALYAYAHLAGDIGIELERYPSVARWCQNVEREPRFFSGPGPYTPDAMVPAP